MKQNRILRTCSIFWMKPSSTGGCFQYFRPTVRTPLPNPVEESVKQERWERFMEKQQISRHRLALKIGRRLEVIIDEKNEEGYLARSSADT